MRRSIAFAFLFGCGIALLIQQGYLVSASAATRPVADAFKDVSRTAGVTNNRVVSLELAIGQAWGDYDNDGWVDLYVTDPAGPNTLYRNNGDGTFARSPLTEQVSLPQAYSAGATFVDFDNDYKTMDVSFMESVWWVFGQLWQKNLVYKGFRADKLKKRQLVYWTQKLEKMMSSEEYQKARESTRIIIDSSPTPV